MILILIMVIRVLLGFKSFNKIFFNYIKILVVNYGLFVYCLLEVGWFLLIYKEYIIIC